MKVDSFVDFPRSNASDELLNTQNQQQTASNYSNGPTFEYFSQKDPFAVKDDQSVVIETPTMSCSRQVSDGLKNENENQQYSASHVPTFNTTAERSNKNVAALSVGNLPSQPIGTGGQSR